jgi:hypothetical protein
MTIDARRHKWSSYTYAGILKTRRTEMKLTVIQHELWLPVPGYTNYLVSDLGRVCTTKTKTKGGIFILKHYIDPKGYYYVYLWKNSKRTMFKVHVLVKLAFTGPKPERYEVRHLDNTKINNILFNLVYGTRSDNQIDKYRHGTMPTKINKDQAKEIRRLRDEGMPCKDIAKMFNVTDQLVSRVCLKQIWRHI